jgi:uncharacterized protein with PhoU and TrkA domain
MAYSYLSTGRDTVMSEDRERVLRMALKAVLVAAQECCVDIDELTELAIQAMYGEQFYNPEDVAEASTAIEVAVDALPVIH